MDIWHYFDVTHRAHTYCNPVSAPTVRDLEAVLDLQPGMRVLDIASGLGEMLIGFAERHGVRGVGVELSHAFLHRAEARQAERVPDADIRFLEMKGEDYVLDDEGPFDVVMCIGASWIWNGYRGTLEALKRFVKPGGLIVVGEPYWRQSPTATYLEMEELTHDQFPTLDRYREDLAEQDLSLVWLRGVSRQEWDEFEMLQTVSFDRYAREHPDDEDLEAIRTKLRRNKEAYLRWGRDTLGFAFWVLRAPGAA